MNVVKERPIGWCCFYWDILGQIAHAEWHCFPRERKGQPTGPQTAIQYCNPCQVCPSKGVALSLKSFNLYGHFIPNDCCIHRLGRVYFSGIFGNGIMYNVQVILFEIDCAIFYTNLHELFCHFISWTNWVNSGKFMDNCWISCQVMADMEKFYDDLIIISLYHLSPFHLLRGR